MHNIPQTELAPQLRRLVQETLATHEPLKISTGEGQAVIMLAERDYHTLLDSLNQIKAIVTQISDAPLNQETRQTFADTDAGEHLTECKDADDMFEKLGI